ncbi:zinc finger, CCHC-type containing protein [Tanacetum coccineum]
MVDDVGKDSDGVNSGNGIDVVVPVKSIRAISERFANTTYSFFLGKRVAYPVVANYVRNTWGKYGLFKSMLNSSTRIFSFQFSSMEGLDAMLKNGPWFIRNNLLILKKWVGQAMQLIEVRADVELKDNIVVVMPKLVEEGIYTCNDECPNNRDLDVVKNRKKPSQTPRGIPVGPNGNKKKDVEPTIEESYENGDYDFDPNNDDMYEDQDIPDKIQDICDSLDIKVRSRKKK